MKTRKLASALPLAAAALAATGCAQRVSGVTITSPGFNTSSANARLAPSGSEEASSGDLADVTDFRFCVKRIRLIASDGSSVARDGEVDEEGNELRDELRFSPGLIDVSSGEQKDWGTLEMPVGFRVSEIRVKVKKDAAACGVNFSLSFNGETTPQDIELRWKFNPPIELDEGTQAISLSFSQVVSALRSAAASGSIGSLKDRAEAVEGTALAR
jgi:hypothetical protein